MGLRKVSYEVICGTRLDRAGCDKLLDRAKYIICTLYGYNSEYIDLDLRELEVEVAYSAADTCVISACVFYRGRYVSGPFFLDKEDCELLKKEIERVREVRDKAVV